jgi:hypothetical protein
VKTRYLVFIAAVLLVLVFCWLRFQRTESSETANVATPAASLSPPQTPVVGGTVSSPLPIATPDPRSKEERMNEILATTSQQPITFYGKVIDQYGNPVVGADVRGNVSISKAWMDQKWDEHFTTTDGSGLFQFTGLRGQELVVSPKKEGYEYKSNNSVFAYSSLTAEKERHRPDSAVPVVFKMWKQQGAEPLITGNKFFGITADGTPFTIDLKNGRKSEGRQMEGDFVVSIKQPPQITDESRFDWSFTIDAIDGGVMEAADTQYLNEAPAAGYQPQISQELHAADQEWRDVVPKTLFVKSRNGNQFARASVEIRANYQGAAVFSVHYFVNPSPGSRNLEYDPSKQVAPR